MMGQPLLSICIPTYNRCDYLKRTLISIVSAVGFGEDVEVVISDNASTDDTPAVANKYVNLYPNIKYFRNEENVRDFNFPLALDRGTGKYVKLNNDNRLIEKDALTYMLEALKECEKEHTPVFFTNRPAFFSKKNQDAIRCNSLDDFIIHLSFFSTGIWIFGSWQEDWDMVKDKMKYSPLQLSQCDWFYQIVSNRGGCVLKTRRWSKIEEVGVRKGYKWFQVHIDNYYTIMRPYLESGKISQRAYHKDQYLQLQRMKLPLTSIYLYNIMPSNWAFDMSGAPRIFWKNFKGYPFFYLFILTSPIWMVYMLVRRFIKIIVKGG